MPTFRPVTSNEGLPLHTQKTPTFHEIYRSLNVIVNKTLKEIFPPRIRCDIIDNFSITTGNCTI